MHLDAVRPGLRAQRPAPDGFAVFQLQLRRRRCDEPQPLWPCGVREFERPRVEGNGPVGQGAGTAVAEVAEQRRTQLSGRQPQLVRAPCQRPEREQGA